jgi:hypothetical protein
MSASTKVEKIQNGVVKIGNCPVDSGQIMLVDPCYIKDFDSNDYAYQEWQKKRNGTEFSYSATCNVTIQSPAQGGQVGCAVATSSGWGDGTYPVYATIEDGRVTEVTIYFENEPKTDWECIRCGEGHFDCECGE